MTCAAVPLRPMSSGTVDVAGRTLPIASLFGYDTARFDLRALVAGFFGTDALEDLHLDPRWNPHPAGLALPSYAVTRNCWDASRALREAVIERSAPVIKALIDEVVTGIVGPIRSHQPLAMMRVNFHGSRAILRFHNDTEYGQRPNAINIWLPVTRVYGSNSMYVESAPGLADFAPVECGYGEALVFYGTELLHGTLDNMSGGTRISYDFRVSI